MSRARQDHNHWLEIERDRTPHVLIALPIEGTPLVGFRASGLEQRARLHDWISSNPDLAQIVSLTKAVRRERRAA